MLRYLHTRYGRDKNLARSPDSFKDADLLIRSSFYQEHPMSCCNYVDENIEIPGENLKNSLLDAKNKDDQITTQKYKQLKLIGDTKGNLEPHNNPHFVRDFLEMDNKRRLRVLKRKLHQEVYLPNVPVSKAKNKKKKPSKVRKSKKCKLKRSKSNTVASRETTSESESSTSYTSTSDGDSTESTTSSSEESDSTSGTTDNSSDTYVAKKRGKSSKGHTDQMAPFSCGHDNSDGRCGLNMAEIFAGHMVEDVIINQVGDLIGDNPSRVPEVGRDCKTSQPITDSAQKEVNIHKIVTCNKEVQSDCTTRVSTTESQTCETLSASTSGRNVHEQMSFGATMNALQKIRSDANEMTCRLKSIVNISEGEILSRTKSEPPSQIPDQGLVPATKSCDHVGRNNLKFLEEELANIKSFIDSTMKNLTRTSWLSLAGNNTSGLEKQNLAMDSECDKCLQDIFMDEAIEMRKVGSTHSEFVQKHVNSDNILINKLRSPISFQDTSIHRSEMESSDINSKNVRRTLTSPLMSKDVKTNSQCCKDIDQKLDQLNNSNFLENLLNYISCDCNDLNITLGDLLRRKLVEKAVNKTQNSEGLENKGFENFDERHTGENNSFSFNETISNVKQNTCKTEVHSSSKDSEPRKEFNTKKFQRTSSILTREANIRRIENSVKMLMNDLRNLKDKGCLEGTKAYNDELFSHSNSDMTINCYSKIDSDQYIDSLNKPKLKRKWRFWKFGFASKPSEQNLSYRTTSSLKTLLPSKDVQIPDGRSNDNPGFQVKNISDNKGKQRNQVIYTNILRAETWTVKQVLTWLETQGLTFCIDPFRLAQINGYHLLKLTRQDVKRLNLGLINSIRFMSSLNKLKNEMLYEMKLRCRDVYYKRK